MSGWVEEFTEWRPMNILRLVHDKIVEQCAFTPWETGGILGGGSHSVTSFHIDRPSENGSPNHYRPNVDYLNQAIWRWRHDKIALLGVFHSHLAGDTSLSMPDRGYIYQIFQALPASIEVLYFPVVLPRERMIGYKATRGTRSPQISRDLVRLI